MSNAQYKIYQTQTFNLAKTLVVKLDEVSIAVNHELSLNNRSLFDKALRDQFPYVPIEAFYKYNLNLSGQYHIVDMEDLKEQTGHPYMTITLLGNEGSYEVDFTKELLENNPSVANEFRYGSYYYNNLVSRYPALESLILGILYPVKLEIVTGAKNGEILYAGGYIKDYLPDSELTGFVPTMQVTSNGIIEKQEMNVIPQLQKWIDKYLRRWTNPEYALTDDLYVAASISVMFMQIPSVIMNIRLENCNTIYAHSFHLKQYFESHGRLGHIVENLPIEAVLWLYRNTQFYEYNLGKELTLKDIVKNVFTPAEIPLTGYDTTHNTGYMPDNILPNPALVKDVLNFQSITSSTADKDISSILESGLSSGRMNERELQDAYLRIADKIKYDKDDTLSTKVLESEMLSLPGRYPFSLTECLLNLWLYSCEKSDTQNKSLSGPIFVTNPLTGSRISMSSINAYRLALYCFNKGSTGTVLTTVPPPEVTSVRMIPRSKEYVPTPEHHYKPTLTEAWNNTHKCSTEEVIEIYNNNVKALHFENAEALNETGTAIFMEMVRQYNVYTGAEDYRARAELEIIMNRHYWAKIPCDVTISVDYPQWLDQIGVNLDGLNKKNLIDLGLELVSAATGLDLTLSKRRADAQRAAIDVLKHFTSYTVQILDSVNFDKGFTADNKVMRIGEIRSQKQRSHIGKADMGLEGDIRIKNRFTRIYEEFGVGTTFVRFDRMKLKAKLSKSALNVTPSRMTLKQRVPLALTKVTKAEIDIPEFYDRDIPPPPITEAKDLAYYKSEPYPKPKDE